VKKNSDSDESDEEDIAVDERKRKYSKEAL